MKPQRTSSLSYGWAWGGAGAAIRRRTSGQGSGALLCLRLDGRPTAFTGCGLVQPLRETARNVLRAWNTELPCDPATACIQGKLNCANLKKLFTLKKRKKLHMRIPSCTAHSSQKVGTVHASVSRGPGTQHTVPPHRGLGLAEKRSEALTPATADRRQTGGTDVRLHLRAVPGVGRSMDTAGQRLLG